MSEDDFNIIYYWENLPELWQVSEQTGPFNREEIRSFVSRCLDPNNHEINRWLICIRNEPIGAIDFFDYDTVHKHCGIGIFIAEEEYRGKGYAGEALHHALGLLHWRGCRSVRAIIYSDNTTSKNLFKKAGFTEGGYVSYKGKPALQYIRNFKE